MPILILLAVAMIVAIVARRVRLPYTVGLVLVGAGIAFAHLPVGATLTHDFIFYLILPPLLFEAALSLRWTELRADAGLLLVLSTLGTVAAALVVGYGCALVMHWPLPVALVFGSLIAATDPVAVIAMFKDNGVRGRLRTLLEAESLFNDAAAAVLFAIAVSIALGEPGQDVSAVGWHLAIVVGGGALIGAITGAAALLLASRSSEHPVQVALTILAAYGSFLGAEQLGASGILATVVSGLVVGNVGMFSDRSTITAEAKKFALEFWDLAAFLANSVVFPMIGVAIGATPFSPGAALYFAAAIGLVLLARAATIYPLSFVFSVTKQRVPMAHQHILWWGGLRGALALAFSLSLPSAMPHRVDIVVTTFAVVAFSIVVQGLTMPVVLRWLGVSSSARA